MSAILSVELLRRTQTVIDYCLRLRPSEKFLVIYDETVGQNILNSFKFSSVKNKESNYLLALGQYQNIPLRDHSRFTLPSIQKHKKDFSSIALAAMEASDAILFLMSNISIMFSEGLKKILSQGKRALFIPYATENAMLRLLPTSSSEVNELREVTVRIAQFFAEADRAAVTSPVGTDIVMKLGDYETRCSNGVAEPGKLVFLPGGIVSRVPNDGSAKGVLVIDRSISAPEFKELHESIILEIKHGNVVDIKGGKEANNLRHFLESLDDPNAYHLTELEVGTNSRCRFVGVDNPVEHTHTLGVVNFALGCDVHIGGRFPGKVHIDSTLHSPSLVLDNNVVLENGLLKV